MTHVEVYTKIWIEGHLAASSSAAVDYTPTEMTSGNLSTAALLATEKAISTIKSKYPAAWPEQGKGSDHGE